MKDGRKPEYPEKTRGDELQKYLQIFHFASVPFCIGAGSSREPHCRLPDDVLGVARVFWNTSTRSSRADLKHVGYHGNSDSPLWESVGATAVPQALYGLRYYSQSQIWPGR